MASSKQKRFRRAQIKRLMDARAAAAETPAKVAPKAAPAPQPEAKAPVVKKLDSKPKPKKRTKKSKKED